MRLSLVCQTTPTPGLDVLVMQYTSRAGEGVVWYTGLSMDEVSFLRMLFLIQYTATEIVTHYMLYVLSCILK